jgi:ribosome recycling factor
MSIKVILETHKKNMDKALDHLKLELRGVRTGRASTGLVEHLRVEYYGNPTPLNQLAALSVSEASSILIKPFDPACLKDIEKAIRTSDLNLAPNSDGKVIRLNIPPLSEERRKQLVHQVKSMGEQVKISIRNVRRDGIKHIEDEEKQKRISEDDRDKGKKEVENYTKDYIAKIDEVIRVKSDEVMKE